MYTKAAEPIRIGNKLVKNRVTFAPTVKFDWTDTTGIAIDRFRRHYEDRARGGVGLICVEATCVEPGGRLSPTQLGLWADGQIPGHRAITDACHAYGATMLVQLHHAGSAVHPECGPAFGPSAVERRGRTCGELTKERIHEIIAAFVAAAKRAQAAGYDGVQLHACHGYLINQFINPHTNLRTDEYGGSIENRARFGCEILRGIREACGPDFLLSMRHSAAETTLAESCAIADLYVDAGADYLQMSDGIGPHEADYPEDYPYNKVCWMGIQVHTHMKGRVPVSVVNGILTPEQARRLIDEGLADTVDSARALLADPNWARAVTEEAEHIPCFDCKVCFWSPFMPHRCPAAAKRHALDPDCPDFTDDQRPIPEFAKKG
ncbi:MAG: NADH:flavin oxidoreductase [Oscillospiraceae bacterium]|nr:NADH:flavin oxidoreductase [Oscillospiraceae bacterium]MBR3554503.1 NADH:flavin oxidoreductase [Oscillospiraceae bacterium]